jgi:hypothetical protein
LGAAYGLEFLDAFRTEEDAKERLGGPVLALIQGGAFDRLP